MGPLTRIDPSVTGHDTGPYDSAKSCPILHVYLIYLFVYFILFLKFYFLILIN